MKHLRIRNQREQSSPSAGRRERGCASDPLLILITTLVLLTAAGLIAVGMPQALDIAASAAYGSTAIDRHRIESDDEGQAASGKQTEPFIADDIRTVGVMYAYADLFCPIEC
jgi:hypothetical protein